MRDSDSEKAVKPHKIGGLCSICEAPCYEIMDVWEEGTVRAGEPKRLGPPMNSSVVVEFLLFDGSRTDMTLCGTCAASLSAREYALLWRKNLAGYLREQNGNTSKFKRQFSNGLLCELGRITCNEIVEKNRGRQPRTN